MQPKKILITGNNEFPLAEDSRGMRYEMVYTCKICQNTSEINLSAAIPPILDAMQYGLLSLKYHSPCFVQHIVLQSNELVISEAYNACIYPGLVGVARIPRLMSNICEKCGCENAFTYRFDLLNERNLSENRLIVFEQFLLAELRIK